MDTFHTTTIHDDNDNDYRQRQIEFVSGLDGGPVSELLLLTLIPPLLAHTLHVILTTHLGCNRWIGFWATYASFMLTALHLSSVDLFTHVDFILTHLLFISLLLSLSNHTAALPPPLPILQPTITYYRSIMMLWTCLSILAVDFSFFPRRFAKVESFGHSLMDMGVGSFVFSMGLSRSHHLQPSPPSSFHAWRKLWKGSLVGWLMGLARFLMTRGVHYHLHVSEYGVHWNFFLTLALVPLLAQFLHLGLCFLLLRPLSQHSSSRDGMGAKYLLGVGLGLAVLYEAVVLKWAGVEQVIMDETKRDGWFQMNKEGMSSLLGYLALFFIGAAFGSDVKACLHQPQQQQPQQQQREGSVAKKWAWILVALSGLDAVLAMQLDVSRRMANLRYVILSAQFNLFLLLAIHTFFSTISSPPTPTEPASSHSPWSCIETLNANSFYLFLLANVVTGAVNLSIRTLDVTSVWHAFGILMAYMGVLILGLWVLEWRVLRSHHVAMKLKSK